MKKFIAMMLVLALAFTFVACGNKPAEEPAIDEPAVMPEADAELPELDLPEDSNRLPEIEMTDDTIEEILATEYMPEEKLAELSALMEQLIAGINDEMMVGTVEITSDMYEYYGIPATEGVYAVVSMPMIGSIAHEVVLVEVPEGTDVDAFAAEMEALKNPMKWVCVQPEVSWVKTSGNYVVSVMTAELMNEGLTANFETVFGA